MTGIGRTILLMLCWGGLTRWLVGIGTIYYSVYLIHDPLLALMKIGLDRAGLGQYEQFGCYLVFGIPVLLGISWVFYRVFEKPFSKRTLKVSAPVAQLDRARDF